MSRPFVSKAFSAMSGATAGEFVGAIDSAWHTSLRTLGSRRDASAIGSAERTTAAIAVEIFISLYYSRRPEVWQQCQKGPFVIRAHILRLAFDEAMKYNVLHEAEFCLQCDWQTFYHKGTYIGK